MRPDELVGHFRVIDGDNFKLKHFDPADTCGLAFDKEEAKELLQGGVRHLRKLQERLYAEKRWSVLIVLQAIDTAGKDVTIEHVMSGVNPQECMVHSFKAPSQLELSHDFRWRAAGALPGRGKIGIFNRSYEDVLVVRVHPELLKAQGPAPKLTGEDIWRQRFKSIREFERHLARNGTIVLKFFLHLSKDEQRHWHACQACYEEAIASTATETSPWHVVPADNKWFSRLVVAAALVDCLEKRKLKFPKVDHDARAAMARARTEFLSEEGPRKRRRTGSRDDD